MRDEVQNATFEKETSQIVSWLDPFSISDKASGVIASEGVTFSDFYLVGGVAVYLIADGVSTVYGYGDLLTALVLTLRMM